MKCEELLLILNEYVDGTLDAAVCAEFSSHLEGCNPCQVVIDNIRHTIQLFKDARPYPMPEAFRARLRDSLAARWKPPTPPESP
jgi:anti-sigma factor RsiW